MTDHFFTAWDGQQYAGTPPPGWQQAPDGRWWAPGTGPDIAPQQVVPSHLSSPQSTNPPNAKLAGLITGGTFLVVAIGLISFAAVSNDSEPQQQTAEFRQFFNNEGIPLRPETTDTQLMALGDSTCEAAAASPDLNSWNQSLTESTRQDTLNDAETEALTATQRRAVLNASLQIYCPEEATRLGIAE